MTSYFIFAGEASGDLHGSKLIKALKQHGASHFCGVGGPLMRAEGLTLLLKMEEFQVMGFTDVVKAFPRLWKYFHQILDHILNSQPAAVILIDYPGFNLRLAKALRKRDYTGKIIQYVCPSVWAHGKKRIQTLVQTLDLLLTIYPFEQSYFTDTSLKVKYVGNPLVENLKEWKPQDNWLTKVNLPLNKGELVALFPGSRPSEIRRHFPLLLQAALSAKEKFPQINLACSYIDENHLLEMQNQLQNTPFEMNKNFFFIPSHFRYELMQNCSAAIAKSGTVTLELALRKKPTLIIYELSRLNYFVAKYILQLKLSHYCIVNIIARSQIFPEIMGCNLSVAQISNAFNTLYEKSMREQISEKCQKVIDELEHTNSHESAAKVIVGLFS